MTHLGPRRDRRRRASVRDFEDDATRTTRDDNRSRRPAERRQREAHTHASTAVSNPLSEQANGRCAGARVITYAPFLAWLPVSATHQLSSRIQIILFRYDQLQGTTFPFRIGLIVVRMCWGKSLLNILASDEISVLTVEAVARSSSWQRTAPTAPSLSLDFPIASS